MAIFNWVPDTEFFTLLGVIYFSILLNIFELFFPEILLNDLKLFEPLSS